MVRGRPASEHRRGARPASRPARHSRAAAAFARLALACALTGAVLACTQQLQPQPPLYADIGAPGVQLDTAEALNVINTYRKAHGLEPLVIDAALMAAAQSHSDDMARNDKVGHAVSVGTFPQRMRQAGQDPQAAGENIGAGYRTIAQAFSGWRGSPDHDKAMLLAGGRRMGIATGYAPHSKYKVFWTLIIAGD